MAVLFCKQHFYKQHQAEINKKFKQKLCTTWRLNFCYLKNIHSHHPQVGLSKRGYMINVNEDDAKNEK